MLCLVIISMATSSFQPHAKVPGQKIQVAVLLDVSNSMDGLIGQAKAQLWNMVSILGKAENNGIKPEIEISLYEYGRSTNDVKDGYIKQINGFSTDLDQLSQNLFGLTTKGGDEYCTNVIYRSLSDLKWDASALSYKVIFIAGNEDFLQGDVDYLKACNEAKKRGVIINTIYCGDRMQGIKEHWNLSECGTGSFTNINQDAKMEDIPTPYDSLLITYNTKLNSTYVGYGQLGAEKKQQQEAMDVANYKVNQSAGLKRVAVKGQGNLYRNSSWDLVDAADEDSSFISKVEMKSLPTALQNKSRADLRTYLTTKKTERSAIQKKIAELNNSRETFLVAERARLAGKTKDATLETEIEKIIREQVRPTNLA